MVAPIHWALWGVGAGAASRRCCTEPGAFSGIYGLLLGGGWAVVSLHSSGDPCLAQGSFFDQ